MRILRREVLISEGSAEMKISKQLDDIESAIESIKNSDDMSKFLLYSGINEVRTYSKKHPNGVKPIKDAFVKYLESQGWVS